MFADIPQKPSVEIQYNLKNDENTKVYYTYICPLDILINKMEKDKKYKREIKLLQQLRLDLLNHFQLTLEKS